VTTLVGQYAFAASVYDLGDRNFYSHIFSLGVDQTLGPRLQGGISAGAELYSTEENGGGESFSPYAMANLTFALGEKTSLSWIAQYSTQEANIVEASTRKNFGTSLQLSYAITPRISASLSGSYNHSDYKGQKVLVFDPTRFLIFFAQPAFVEDAFDAGLNVGYSISPRMSANLGMHYTDVESDLSERPYSRLRFSAGLGYSF
jgi:outer membrane protein assembly factor BamA